MVVICTILQVVTKRNSRSIGKKNLRQITGSIVSSVALIIISHLPVVAAASQVAPPIHIQINTPDHIGLPTSIRIVNNGLATAIIILPDDVSNQLELSAKILQSYIEKSSGARLPIRLKHLNNLQPNNKKVKIWIGFNPTTGKSKRRADWEQLDDDGFLILFHGNYDIFICGKTNWGTKFGVYHFLETYLGVRWLLPGPDGEYVPKLETVDVPKEDIWENPSFIQRRIGGLRGKWQTEWAYYNRMHKRAKYGHNLYNVIPPAIYSESHPEFFPLVNGKRLIPTEDERNKWQPCFTASGIVEAAVKNICRYFKMHPDEIFFSLGANHTTKWCECDKCRLLDSGGKNYLGLEDYSDRYFTWANQVVERVLKKYPDKWFGALAHANLAEPPKTVSVHPRIIPFITYERLKWVREDIEEEGKKVTEAWANKCSVVGWYDYIYGTPYCLPRIYFHQMAKYYRYGHSKNVKYMAVEAFPNWGEGPKYYLSLRLQWDPYLNVDQLLTEWYEAAVGKEAAPYLAVYYKKWERFWTERIPKSDWYTKKGAYLPFKNPHYLDIVTYDDISESRRLLETVLNKAVSKEQVARATILLRAFEYYEASAISYLGIVLKKKLPDKSDEYYKAMNRKRYELIEEFRRDPILIHPIAFDEKNFPEYRW